MAKVTALAFCVWGWMKRIVENWGGDRTAAVLGLLVAAVVLLSLESGSVPSASWLGCHTEDPVLPSRMRCTYPKGVERPDVVVWGNSHVGQLMPAIDDWAIGRDLSFRQATMSGCLPLFSSQGALAGPKCVTFNQAALAEWRLARPQLVVMGGAWTLTIQGTAGDDDQQARILERELAYTLDTVRAALGPDTAILLVADMPTYDFHPSECRDRRRRLELETQSCDWARPNNAEMASKVDAILERLSEDRIGVSVYRPWASFCEGTSCRTFDPALGQLYKNRDHLLDAGAQSQADRLRRALDSALGDAGATASAAKIAPELNVSATAPATLEPRRR